MPVDPGVARGLPVRKVRPPVKVTEPEPWAGLPAREVTLVEETPPVPWTGLPARGQDKEDNT